MGQSTGLGRGSGCWGKPGKLTSCPPLLPGPVSLSVSVSLQPQICLSVSLYLFLCLILVFSLSHISLIRPLTFTPQNTHQAYSVPLACVPHASTPTGGENTHILRKLQGQTFTCSLPLL